MNRKKRFLISFVLVVLVHFFITPAGVMAASKKAAVSKPVAEVIKGPNGIDWIPNVNYERLILNIARPDGKLITKTFKAGSPLYFDLSSAPGNRYPDGSYTYELRVIPVGVVEGETRKSHQETLSQTGYFTVQGGVIVTGTAPEKKTSATCTGEEPPVPGEDPFACPCFTIDCDTIVIGSFCVGADCNDGEDCSNIMDACNGEYKPTFKLKEQNVRFLFQDTSTSEDDPANDWQIVINDDTLGGGEYFAVQDVDACTLPFTIEAGAPNNSVYVQADGDVGIGTSTPECCSAVEIERTGENSRLILERTDGNLHHERNAIVPCQAALEAHIDYVSVGSRTEHPLRLVVNKNWKMRFYYKNGNYQEVVMQMWNDGGYDGTWYNASSRKLKENIKDLTTDEAMAALEGLNPVKFNYKKFKDEEHVGFIAEDVPELVATNERKSMSSMDVVAVLTKVVQQQQKSIEEQQRMISELKKEINNLKNK